MVGDSKILTVSYGTFSCTLEGFDDPFSTMKAIAEYFRDLAADDRYFGAEPPTPDAQMLHQIAEREVQRRVEAKIQENGVVLRAGEGAAPEALPAAAPTPAAAPDAAAPVAAAAALAAATDDSPEAPAEAPAAKAAEADPEYTATPDIETPLEPDSVAAKLLRIRAAVAQAREGGAVTPAPIAAPVKADTGLRPHLAPVEDVPEDSDFEADAPEAVLPEAAIPAAAFAAPEEEPAAETPETGAPVTDEAVTEEPAAEEPAAEEPVAEAPAEDADVVDEAPVETPAEDTFADAAEEDEPADVAQDDDAAVTLANIMAAAAPAPAAEGDAAEDTDAGQDADDEAPATDGALEDTVGSFLSTLGDDAIEDTIEDAPETPAAADADADEAGDETGDETAVQVAEVTDESADEDADGETAEDAPATTPAQSLLARARARVIKVRRVDNGAPEIVRDDEDTAAEMDEPADHGTPVVEEAAADEIAPEETPEETPAEDRADDAAPAEDAEDAPETALPEETPEEGAALPQAPEEDYDDEGELAAEDSAQDTAADHADDAATVDEDDADADASPETAEEAGAAEDDAEAALSPEDEAELQAELQAVEREVEAHRRADRGGRNLLETSDAGADDSINRLMRQTEDHMEGAENRRRLSTIAHLKAAVAAREADRELGEDGDEKQEDALRSYRDDLARVVRPRRPASEGGTSTRRPVAPADRPAPLVLVSEQRIDRPSEARPAAQPIRPRRIAAGNLAVDESEDDDAFEGETGNVFTDSSSFAEFAEKIGATALPDLLEAAAAYSNCVEGREHFTRPEIMRFAAIAGRDMGTEAGEGFSREAGLRSFGMLLREGKIKKIKRGQFAISQSSRFIPEARKIAR